MKLCTSLLTIALSVTLSLGVAAQTRGSYTLYGSGCASSVLSGGVVLPRGYDSQFGLANSRIPLGFRDTHYMQAHDASELPATALIRGFNFRNHQSAITAYSLKLTIKAGYTKNSARALSYIFANNWSEAATTVFTGIYNLKALPPSTDPKFWGVKIPFTAPFIYVRARGNFLWECRQHTASVPSNYLSAAAGTSIQGSRVWAQPAAATQGRTGPGYTLCMQLAGTSGARSIVKLQNTGVPEINKSFSVDFIGAVPSSVAILWLGGRRLNLSLSPVLPGCTLYSSLDVMLGGVATGIKGSGSMNIAIPNNQSLVGLQYYNQWMVVDQAANGLGIVLSNGGAARIGG